MRLFFALWPSPARRHLLAAMSATAVARVDGVPVPPSNLHVTLAFLGSVTGHASGALFAVGGQGSYPSVDLRFDRLDYWPKPKVLVAMATELPAGGVEIVDRLWRGIEPLGFEREQRPWRPHLTLARKLRHPPPDDLALEPPPAGAVVDPAPWSLALVESVTHPDGARYRPLAEWPLGSRGDAHR